MNVPLASRRAAALVLAVLVPGAAGAQQPRLPERAVRRDIPMTQAIRDAFAAGTRDSTGRPGARYWQLRTDYTISARLDTATSRITGRETIALHNTSPDSLRVIAFRLDPNIFLPGSPHGAPWVPGEVTDGMVITRMAVDGRAVNLSPGPQPRGPQAQAAAEPRAYDLNTTLARVMLPAPIVPGAVAQLEVEWSFQVPGGQGQGHRMTMRWGDTLYQPTQWYPRVAVYDDLRGWDRQLYLGPSEFYNNFGRFDVSLDVPAGWVVSGTGVLQNPDEVLTPESRRRLAQVLASDSVTTIVTAEERGPGRATAMGANGRLTWRFVADTVNDFAWATSRAYMWQATRAAIPGGATVPIHMAFTTGRARLYATAGPVARHALQVYSRLWFPYPFPQLTLQDGPSAGMEYPMVINSNQGAADHETGHQWWPMTVSNNETWYGWMDEGFDQYMNILSAADRRARPADFDGMGQFYGQVSGNEAEPPMMWNANYDGPDFYGFTTYNKTPLMLSMLGGIVGDSAVQRAHGEWARAWMFRHPSPWDYMFFMDRALGRDLGWFWYSWLFTTESVDGSIASASTRGTAVTVTVRQDGQMPSPVVLEVKLAPGAARPRLPAGAVMTDSATALLTYPVDVWFAGSRSFTATFDFGRRVERLTLDPRCRFPDRDATDNVFPRGSPPPACARSAPPQR